MKTKYKYIEFEFITATQVWLITNWKYKQHIGQLNYIPKWKQWELVPYEDTGWTMDCLADIIDFVKQRLRLCAVPTNLHKLNTK